MNNSITITDLNRICRICLETKNMMSISPMTNYMLETCTSAQEISNEKMPQQICIDCYGQLKNAYNFKQRCLVSFQILSEIIFKSDNVRVQNANANQEIIIIKTEYILDEDSNDISDINDIKDIKNITIKREISDETIPQVLNVKEAKVEEKNDNTVNSLNSHINNYLGKNWRKIPQQEKTSESKLTPDEMFHKLYRKNKVPTIVTCHICGKKIRWRYLRVHQKCHSDNKPYECNICHVTFKRSFEVNKHKRIVHSTGNDGKELCFVCGKLVMTPLNSHLSMHNVNENIRFKCDKCDKSYPREDCLRIHVRLKHPAGGIKTYTCHICQKTVTSSLKSHMQNVHSDGKREYACKCCNKTYKNKSILRRHIQTAHLDVRPYKCTICEGSFHSRVILENHMRTHTGERPFKCNVCDKSFSFNAALRTHKKVHNK